jgi:hypothetical protein
VVLTIFERAAFFRRYMKRKSVVILNADHNITAKQPRSPILTRLRHKLGRKGRALMLRAAEVLLWFKLVTPARWCLERAAPVLSNTRRVRAVIGATFAGRPSTGKISAIRLQDMASRLKRHVALKEYPELLRIAVEYEVMERPMPLAVGDLLARQMVSDPGRDRIRKAAQKARARAPHSPYLIYLQTVVLAKQGEYQTAAKIVQTEIEAVVAADYRDPAALKRAQKSFEMLRGTWRAVDNISRQDMGWADADGGDGYADLAITGKIAKQRRNAVRWDINFKEPLLQARDEAGYLQACLTEFRQTGPLLDRIRVISDMLRQGARPQLSYHRAHAQAQTCYDTLRPEIAALTQAPEGENTLGESPDRAVLAEPAAVMIVRMLVNAMGVLRMLHRDADIEALKWQLYRFAQRRPDPSALWLILPEILPEAVDTTPLAQVAVPAPTPASAPVSAPALAPDSQSGAAADVSDDASQDAAEDAAEGASQDAADAFDLADNWEQRALVLRRTLPVVPLKEHHLKAFLRWALWTRAFAQADRVFHRLPAALQTSQAALYYVNILQRQSRFGEALRILRQIHANTLARPAQLAPFQHWNLLRRDGELNFLNKTAIAFARVPQPETPPETPVGVLIIGARNLDQLRKYPLVVLMELRRQGWAIISLVEGLLPRFKTGDPAIDVLSGCITMERGLTRAARTAFAPLEGFVANPAAGQLDWMGLNLRHSMLEDARISRRTYDVDFSCPVLSANLQRLSDWTALMAQATVYARTALAKRGLRCGLMSLYNSRLPDSLFRLYCDKVGDPNRFFALQTANGYENYFANFGNRISTRCVVRNMTRINDVRSASFPSPAVFESYYQANSTSAEEVLIRLEHIATVRRSTGLATVADPAAVACEARVMEWRAKGGKVACLFGRVVCDSAVPFDGGPGHADLKDWLRHSIEAVRGSDTLLLIKPHPYELNEQIATYLNQYFADLIGPDLLANMPDNVIMLGHRWFDISAMARFVDLGLIYNGTVAVEMALLNIPCIQCNYFGPIDYPLGHIVAESRAAYAAMLRFELPPQGLPDMRARAALWLDYMSNGRFALDYRYHERPVTNKVIYPPLWIAEDLERYFEAGDPHVVELAGRITGSHAEPQI